MGGLRRAVAVCALGVLSLAGGRARGEAILLDFQTDWCGYWRMMEPVVQQLAAEGYHIRKVNGDQEANLVRKFRVEGYPTFIALCDDREVGRLSGEVNKALLRSLLDKAAAASRQAGGEKVRGQSPDGAAQAWVPAGSSSASTSALPNIGQNPLIAASVRLRIQDVRGQSTGSGTIIDARDGEALILTCGHMFRECRESGQILVDLFGPAAPKHIPGTLVSYDLNSDVGLVRIEGDYRFVAAQVASASYQCRKGETVVSVGCDNGADATPRTTQIVSVNRYTHAPNLQVAFEPVQGRSGGGLFNSQGQVIGVCNAADAEDKQGLFAALPAIHAELDRTRLSFVYDGETRPEAVGFATNLAVPAMHKPMPNVDVNDRLVALTDRDSSIRSAMPEPSAVAGLTDEEQALLKELRSARGAEVICLVRSLDGPQAKSRVLQLNRASAAFWRELAADSAAASSHRLTSLDYRVDAASAPVKGSIAPATSVLAQKTGALTDSADRVWPPRAASR